MCTHALSTPSSQHNQITILDKSVLNINTITMMQMLSTAEEYTMTAFPFQHNFWYTELVFTFLFSFL